MAAEQPIDPYGDGQEKPYHSSSGLFDHHADLRWSGTSPRPIVNPLGRTRWLQSKPRIAPPRLVEDFRQTCPHVSPTGAFKKYTKNIQADFLSHLFVDRQLNLPVVLRIGTAVLSVLETHGRQEASCSKVSLWKDPALRY